VTTVKKYVPPATFALRYSISLLLTHSIEFKLSKFSAIANR
jgi:hypothetical protein